MDQPFSPRGLRRPSFARPFLLVCAFRPFGGRGRNESAEALAALRLPPAVRRRVRTLVLPVSWRRAVPRLARELDRPGLFGVVLVGEAGGRTVVTAETWGRNAAARLRDEDGRLPPGPRLARAGAVRRKATWRPREVVTVLRRAGIPAAASRDAGGFLCNAVLYATLERLSARRPAIPVTFLHLPIPGAGARADLRPAHLARALSAVVLAAATRFAPRCAPMPAR